MQLFAPAVVVCATSLLIPLCAASGSNGAHDSDTLNASGTYLPSLHHSLFLPRAKDYYQESLLETAFGLKTTKIIYSEYRAAEAILHVANRQPKFMMRNPLSSIFMKLDGQMLT